jgi:putative intracellular protease/amidase
MPLVEVGSKEAQAPKGKPLAILVFDGVEIIDFTAPWEVFGAAGFDVYTVAASKDPIVTSMGMKLIPDHTFADAPAPAVLLVPGGAVKGARASEPTLRWVRETSGRAEETLSVCNSAFILANAARVAVRARDAGRSPDPQGGPGRRRARPRFTSSSRTASRMGNGSASR